MAVSNVILEAAMTIQLIRDIINMSIKLIFFVFYNIKRDIIAIVPIEDIGEKSCISLRIAPPKNNQGDVKFFSDYSFDKILCVETLHAPSENSEEEKVQTTIGN